MPTSHNHALMADLSQLTIRTCPMSSVKQWVRVTSEIARQGPHAHFLLKSSKWPFSMWHNNAWWPWPHRPSLATRRHAVQPFSRRRRTRAPRSAHRTSAHRRIRISPMPALREVQLRSDHDRLFGFVPCKRARRGRPVMERWQHAAQDGWRPFRTRRQAGRDRSANPRSLRTDTCPCWPSRSRAPERGGADGSCECLSG